MKNKWKDTTSYSQSDVERVPREWTLEVGSLQVIVHRYHGCEGWFGSCYGMGVERTQLTSVDGEDAKLELVRLLYLLSKRRFDAFSTAYQRENAKKT